jgi:hypothetical protein
MSELDWSGFMPGGGAQQRDKTIPTFKIQPVQNTFRTQQEGRAIYDEKEFVEIIVPGERGSLVFEEVTDEHRARWPRQYDAFKRGLEPPTDGTPIEQWPPISQAKALELRSVNVRTVENLADVDDARLRNLGPGGFELRKQAQVWLDAAKNGAAPIARLVAENQRLRDDKADLERQLAEKTALVDRLTADLRAKEKADAA